MLPFLQTLTKDFSEPQLRALQDLINRAKSNSAIGLDESQALISKVRTGVQPLFDKPVFGAELLDPCKLSTALEALRADLSALIEIAEQVERDVVSQQDVETSLIQKIHQAILKLDEMILTNKLRNQDAGNTHISGYGFSDIKLIDFVTSVNESVDQNKALIDSGTGLMSCGTSDIIRFAQRRGDLKPVLSVTYEGNGVNPEQNISFIPDDALLASDKYAWAEVLLSDVPLTATFNDTDYNGAVVTLIIDLPQTETINEFKLAPFGRYPLYLISATYLDGDAYSDVPNITLPAKLELDSTQLNFGPINTRQIKLTFHQPDYRLMDYVLEKGHLKKSNWLSVLLERSLESNINDQGTLEFALQDQRREMAEAALEARLGLSSLNVPKDRYVKAIEDIVDINSTDYIQVRKYEYVAGLKHLEINYKRYLDSCNYIGPKLKAGGSVVEAQLVTDVTNISIDDGVGTSPISSVAWQVDFGGGRIFDIKPSNEATTVYTERLNFDANRTAKSRFISSGTINVHRDGERLTLTDDYTVVTSTYEFVTILPTAWRPNSVYTLTYSSSGSGITLLDTYGSIKPNKPEVFYSTDKDNRVSLSSYPFVLTELTQNPAYWTRPDPIEALWYYRVPTRSGASAAPYVIKIDGEDYGEAPFDARLTAAENATDTSTIIVESASGAYITGGVPSSGVIKVDDEYIYYASYTTDSTTKVSLAGCIRGYNNSVNASHLINAPVKWVASSFYEPITVLIDGVRAKNISDYANGRHPAFSNQTESVQYIQIGNSLYFDRPVNKKIEVWYRRLADYVQVRAKLFTSDPKKEYTPVINNYILNLKTATL